jgi:hypothetical protein
MCENILKAEGIEIKIEEVNGLKTINIVQADNCNIKFKGNIILENTKEEFSAIPVQIRELLKGYANIIEEKNGETIFDIDTAKANYCCEIKTIITDESKESLYMNNWLLVAEKIQDYTDIDVKKYNKKIEVLMKQAEEKGFEFYEYGDGDTYDVLYRLQVPVKDFNMDKVKEFLTSWEDYNIEMKKFVNEY